MAMDQIHSCVTPTSGRCSSTTKTSSISPPQAQLTSRSWIREWEKISHLYHDVQAPGATYYPLPSFSKTKQRKSLLVSTCNACSFLLRGWRQRASRSRSLLNTSQFPNNVREVQCSRELSFMGARGRSRLLALQFSCVAVDVQFMCQSSL
uniref:Uncharacterized protein n=1 Tax=Aegilops tauschii TaxID=37682 RepID=M8C4S9_AEGTA